MADARTRGWGRGWPTNRSADMRPATGGGVTVWVHKGIRDLVQIMMQRTEQMGYDLKPGQCWGYANRPIRGTLKPSNHSWGLAVDLNALSNPQRIPLTTNLPHRIIELWEAHGFVWGGRWGHPDPMHFEYMGTPKTAMLHLAKARGVGSPPPAPTPPVTPPAPSALQVTHFLLNQAKKLTVKVGEKDPVLMAFIRQALIHAYPGEAIFPQGDFDNVLKLWVIRYQREHGLAADGIVGPATWASFYPG